MFSGATVFAYQNPSVSAGPDLYLTSGQTTTLQGTAYDPNGFSLSYYWTCTGGSLSSYNVAQPVYTAPYAGNYNNQVSYTCTLTATNTYGLSSTDNMTIFVNYNNNNSTGNTQTNSATNINTNQATLNGYFSNTNFSGTNYVYFQWGTTTSYGNQTAQQPLNYSGSFSQNIVNLLANTTYHFRAVSQGGYGTVYGQDLTFYTTNSGYYYSSGILTVTKKVINLTSGNLNWQSLVTANPGDVLAFAITLQAGNQDIHNVVVYDTLPANLSYVGNMTVNANLSYAGTPMSGINIGTIPANGVEVISYQTRVASSAVLPYGISTLSNSATITSTEAGTQTAVATVLASNSYVAGANYNPTSLPTGLTNDPVKDSFFLPIALIILMSWLYFSGRIYNFADWIGTKIN